jgi:hypothetical protein
MDPLNCFARCILISNDQRELRAERASRSTLWLAYPPIFASAMLPKKAKLCNTIRPTVAV